MEGREIIVIVSCWGRLNLTQCGSAYVLKSGGGLLVY